MKAPRAELGGRAAEAVGPVWTKWKDPASGDAWFYNAEAGEFFFGARPAPWVLYQTAATVTRVQHISLPPFESITRVNGDDVSHVRNTIQHSQ